MELETPHETQSYLFYQTKIIWFENEEERDIEKKGTDEIPYTNLCCVILLFLVLLSASLFSPRYCLCRVCALAFFFFFFWSLPSYLFVFFFVLCVSRSIYKEIPKKLFLILPSTDQIMEQISSIFPPHLLISCWAVTHFSAFFSFLYSVAF